MQHISTLSLTILSIAVSSKKRLRLVSKHTVNYILEQLIF